MARTILCLATISLLPSALVAGCGGGAGSSEAAPPELQGTYVTTLERTDLPSGAPQELLAGGWRLSIGDSGEPGAGTSLVLKDPENQLLGGSAVEVDGDILSLTQAGCAQTAGDTLPDDRYRWKLDGSTLTLEAVKDDCPNEVVEAILTSRPWVKQ